MMRCPRRRHERLVGRDGLKRARLAGKHKSQNVFCFEAGTPAWLLPPLTGFDSCAGLGDRDSLSCRLHAFIHFVF
jgi:hypothetical protein